MADTLLRLRVDNKEYDDKLKRATEGLNRYVDGCRKAGGTLEHLDDGVLDFVKALGQMDTVSQGGTQSLREMTKSITDLTIKYNSLTNEEKQSPFGQALSRSIDQLTERAGVMRDAMGDVQAAIKNAASDTRVFDQISGTMSLATASFQTFQGAAKLLGVELGDNVEVIAKLQAAMAVTNGLTQIQNTLQKQSAVMQGVAALQTKANAVAQALLAKNTKAATVAGEAFNAVARMNPYVLIASAVVAASTALIAFSSHQKKATEATKENEEALKRAKDAADNYKNTMASEYAQMMVKYDELKRAWQSLSTAHEKTQWIEKNKKAFAELGISVDNLRSAEDVFEQNTATVINGFKRRAEAAAIAANMVDLYRQKMEVEQTAVERYNQKRAVAYHTFVPQRDLDAARQAGTLRPDANPNQWGETTYNNGLFTRNGNRFVFTKEGAEQYNKTLFQTDEELKEIKKEHDDINKTIEKRSQRLIELEKNTAQISSSTETTGAAEATSAVVQAEIQREMQRGLSITTTAGMNAYISQLKQQIDQADLGSDLYNSLTSKLTDATMLQNLVKESLSVGIGTAIFDIADETGQDFWDRVLSPEGVENADWQAIADVINQKRKELGLDAITLDFSSGSVSSPKGSQVSKEQNEQVLQTSQQIVGGLSQVSSGLNQLGITIPEEAQSIINGAQGLISVIQGIGSLIQIFSTTTVTAQVSALTANTTALLALAAAIGAEAGMSAAETAANIAQVLAMMAMANGGIVPHAAQGYAVPGTHYSGDTTPILANAGELVLNRAQQGNLASQLQDGTLVSSGEGRSFVSGQDIFLGTNNYLKSTGQGEIVTTKMLRRLGVS